MNTKLIQNIDKLIEECDAELISDTSRFISINSQQSKPMPNAPFGEGPRKMLDTIMEMGEKEGFFTKDYGVGVVSLSLGDGQPDLGIWIHGDVVAEGTGWNFDPFNATLHNNCIIGRGATDNKGQLSAIFNLFKIFKRLGVKFNYIPAIYVGSNEESGMKDMTGIEGNPDAKGFINVCTPPKLSLVPDGSFPIGYGAKGVASFFLKSKIPLDFSLTAGSASEPGLATAIFDSLDVEDELQECTVKKTDKTHVSAFSAPRHTAHPSKDGNMITMICSALLQSRAVSEKDKRILSFFKDISLDINGNMFNINVDSEFMSDTIVCAQSVTSEDLYPEIKLRVRYPIEISYEELLKRIGEVGENFNFEVRGERSHAPYANRKDTETVKLLAQIANEITGRDADPYINGSTYAHYLPNAYIYGMEGCCPPDDFDKGRGGAHGIDESVSVLRLKRAMKIYARAMLGLNDIKE